jgi:hypothetical protein
MKIIKHIGLGLIVLSMTSCGLFGGGADDVVEEATELLEEVQEEVTGASSVKVLTQKGGAVEVFGGDCVLDSVEDPLIENVLGDYEGGDLYTYSCDESVEMDEVKAHGRLGGVTCKDDALVDLDLLSLDWDLIAEEGVIGGEGITAELVPANSECIKDPLGHVLPAPCLWLASYRYLTGEDTSIGMGVVDDPLTDWLDKSLDDRPINMTENVAHGYTKDDNCVLVIDQIGLDFDWEDPILPIGYLNKDETSTLIDEGSFGGVYSNLHYAVVAQKLKLNDYVDANNVLTNYFIDNSIDNSVPGKRAAALNDLVKCGYPSDPCDSGEKDAYEAWQFLLHLAKNDLAEISQESLDPDVVWDSLIPGPFYNKIDDDGYIQCEWLDMVLMENTLLNFTPPYLETLNYENFVIWDWTGQLNEVETNPCVAIIVWEGDGRQTEIARDPSSVPELEIAGITDPIISPTDIADDFVGFFQVCYEDGAVTLSNYSEELHITFSTDDSNCP